MRSSPPPGHHRGAPPAAPPHRVLLPINVHHWDQISFLHWPVDPDQIQSLLPAHLRVDIYDETAWIGVTPFFIRVRPLGLPVVLPGWSFPETNVRTYVVGPDGRHGIWFLRMEVTAGWFAVALRTLGLPYVRQDMAVETSGDAIRYRSWASEPRVAGGYDIIVRPDAPVVPPTGGPLEQFLTARWDAYHQVGRRLLRTSVEHAPWQLRTAHVDRCDVGAIFEAIGVTAPADRPLAHISSGVVVRLALPTPSR